MHVFLRSDAVIAIMSNMCQCVAIAVRTNRRRTWSSSPDVSPRSLALNGCSRLVHLCYRHKPFVSRSQLQ